MKKFDEYVVSMQDAVRQINLSKEASETKSGLILKALKEKALSEKQELEKIDSVPPVIKIKSL